MESQHLIQNTKWHRIFLYNIVTVDLKSPTSRIWFITLTHPFILFYAVHKKEKKLFSLKEMQVQKGRRVRLKDLRWCGGCFKVGLVFVTSAGGQIYEVAADLLGLAEKKLRPCCSTSRCTTK
jgi:hypothetical protein